MLGNLAVRRGVATAAGSKTVMIVESPAKASKIQDWLGSDYKAGMPLLNGCKALHASAAWLSCR